MPTFKNALLAVCATASLAAAKLDYGACPTGIQQVPYSADLDGLYYLQYYDEFLEYVTPIFNAVQKANGLDCFNFNLKIWEPTYDRDSLPLKKRLWRPYLVYQDASKNAVVAYMCFDSRFLSDLLAVGLKLPDWSVTFWNKFTEIFQTFHLKLIAVGSKATLMDAAVVDDVADYINTFPYKKSFPYKFPKDFKLANQDNAKCGRPAV